MTGRELTDYSALGGVVDGVRTEMEQMVDEAEKAGVKRWNIIIDPGVGFAKSLKGNVTLLRNFDKLVAPGTRLHGYPMLVGASRKGFIGAITGRTDPQQREFGNAAVTSMCCQSAVTHIIRVHEPGPAKDVISMWAA
jgi:dihydroneopterin aldolase/2-amino-4-hydroxy-6-hydroxymethyldihydropteridine diphosphokinase/dihydropteroate synthase